MSILSKTAVVTGSTSGICLGCARAFAGAGANIVLNGTGAPADVEKTRSTIESDFGVKANYSPANMAEPMEIASMISLAEKTLGRVDELVNNAGVQHVSPIEDFPVEKWDAVIAINLSSAFHTIRAVTLGMKQRGWGRIINTASAHSLVASPFKSAHVAAKHGIAGLTKTVALELARSEITCNCISPGYVWTPLTQAGQLIEATALLQSMFRREPVPAGSSAAPLRISLPGRTAPTINLKANDLSEVNRAARAPAPTATPRRSRPLFDRAKDGTWLGLQGVKRAPASITDIVPGRAKFVQGTYSNAAGSRL